MIREDDADGDEYTRGIYQRYPEMVKTYLAFDEPADEMPAQTFAENHVLFMQVNE